MLATLALAARLIAPVDVQQPDTPVTWVLKWQAPAACPSRAELVAEILSYVDGAEPPAEAAPRAQLRIEVDVAATAAGGWRAELRLSGRDGNGERELEAANCAELARTVALVSAVTLDPVLVAATLEREAADREAGRTSTSEPEPEPEPAPSSAVEPGPDLSPVSLRGSSPSDGADDDADPGRAIAVVIGASGGGGWGPLDSGSPALAASVGLAGPRWRALVHGGGWPPVVARLADGRGGRLSGWWLGARGCFVARFDRAALAFPTCAGAEGGQLRARGVAPTTNTRLGIQPWVGAIASQGLRWTVRAPLVLALELDLIVPLVRASFLIGDATLRSITAVGVRGGLGIELRF